MDQQLLFPREESFPNIEQELLQLPDAGITLHREFLTAAEASTAFGEISQHTPWSQMIAHRGNDIVKAPRMSCHFGEGQGYWYGRERQRPMPWPQDGALARIRERLEKQQQCRFNSCVAQRYRDGRDSVQWHSDLWTEIVPGTMIATVSLGATRHWCLRYKKQPIRIRIPAEAGSLLCMGLEMQKHWEHCIPKVKDRNTGPRISLTFRKLRA